MDSDNSNNYHFLNDPIVRWDPSWSLFSVISSNDVEFVKSTEESEMDYSMSNVSFQNKWRNINAIQIASFYEGAIGSEYERTQILDYESHQNNTESIFDNDFFMNLDGMKALESLTKREPRERNHDDLYALCFLDVEPKLSKKPTPAEITAVKEYRAKKRNKMFGNERSFR